MDNIVKLNIKIRVIGGIQGDIKEPYKYNVNTDPKSQYSSIYIPTHYDLATREKTNSKLKDITLYLDKSKLQDFLKRSTANMYKSHIDSNIVYILKLLFKKNKKFFIKEWPFTIIKSVKDDVLSYDHGLDGREESGADDDSGVIEILNTGVIPKNKQEIIKRALAEKHKEIKKQIMEPYIGLSTEDFKFYEPDIKKRTILEYQKFLADKTKRERYVQKYINHYKDSLNTVRVTLMVIPSINLIQYAKKKGIFVPQQYRPKPKFLQSKTCKVRKNEIYEEFMDLLCSTPSKIAKNTPQTSKYRKAINSLKKNSRKYIGTPSKDIPFCKKYNKSGSLFLGVWNLPDKPAYIS